MPKKSVFRKVKPKKRFKKLYFDDLTALAGVDGLEEFEMKVFFKRETSSIRPSIMFQKPLDDINFYALNFPYIKVAYFST